MYLLNNAFKNLGRNKGRNILLGIIMFILILSTTVALVINATTKEIINDYKTRFGSKVTLSVDFDKLMADNQPNADGTFSFPTAPDIDPEQYLSFADSEHLKTYQIDMLTGVIFDKLKAVGENENSGMVGSIGNGSDDYISPKAKLLGYSDANNLPGFADGLRKIIDGTLYQSKNECLVSSEFAELNNLKVNDSFKIIDSTSKKSVTLKVSGIYADATKATGDIPAGSMSLETSYDNRRNEILVDFETMRDNFDINSLMIHAEYELKSPELVGKFEAELRTKGLPDAYNVETDEASYNKIVGPVIGLSKVSMTFMRVILAIGSIILLFITSMAIRERKYEIGVLRAMGLKKVKVVMMLVIEMFIITVLCLGLGLGIGNAISQPIADTLIAEQAVVSGNTQQGNILYSNGSIGMNDASSEVEPFTEIDVSLTTDAVIQIAVVALMLALLSSTAGVIFITKYEPMQILSERN